MTESEAIEELKYDCNELGKAIPCDTSWGKSFENAYAMAIKALEEVQQYHKIGTPEEFRAAAEKQTAKKAITYRDTNRADCPACGATVRGISAPFGNWCSKCGQRLDWEDEE